MFILNRNFNLTGTMVIRHMITKVLRKIEQEPVVVLKAALIINLIIDPKRKHTKAIRLSSMKIGAPIQLGIMTGMKTILSARISDRMVLGIMKVITIETVIKTENILGDRIPTTTRTIGTIDMSRKVVRESTVQDQVVKARIKGHPIKEHRVKAHRVKGISMKRKVISMKICMKERADHDISKKRRENNTIAENIWTAAITEVAIRMVIAIKETAIETVIRINVQ